MLRLPLPRLVLAALAVLLAAPAAHAQATFGLTAGLNVSTFSGNDAPDNTDPRLGFSGGVFANVPLGMSGAFVQPEARYSMKGVTGAASNVDGTIAVDYAEIPLLVGYATPVTASGLVLGAYAGPALGIKVRESADFRYDGGSASVDLDVFEDIDVGAAVGVTVGAGAFGIDARYTFGLTDVVDNAEVRNGAFTIGAVYQFGR